MTGISSPWISSYKVAFLKNQGNVIQFSIQYQFTDGGKETWKAIAHINIIHVDRQRVSSQQLCISRFNYLSPVDQLVAK